MDREVRATNNQTFFNAICTPERDEKFPEILRNTEGALLLVNNYILTYRCQADRAAEGRQFFEVPGFLTSAGAATAAALGAGPHVAIGAGAAAAVLGQGKSYYAPKDKAVVLNDGVDALLCVQNEAVGIDAYALKALSNAQAESGVGAGGQPAPAITGTTTAVGESPPAAPEGPEVYISSERQYFEMIRTALFAVERVIAQRLNASGTPFDTAGVIAELEKINKEIADKTAEKDANNPKTEGGKAKDAVQQTTADKSTVRGFAGSTYTLALQKLAKVPDEQVGRTVIKLRALQPRLQQCIIHAKV